MSHLGHALVSLFLCGLWIPVWILAAASNASEPYRCSQCGSKVRGSSIRVFVALAAAVFVVWVIAASFLYNNYSGSSTLTPAGPGGPSHTSAHSATEPNVPSLEDEAKAQREVQEREARTQREAAEKRKSELAANALKFHQELADKGDAYGQYQMGLRYMNGDGVEKDWFKASDYLGKAAVQGRADAAAELNKLLARRGSQTN
jgi:hypothetical protein